MIKENALADLRRRIDVGLKHFRRSALEIKRKIGTKREKLRREVTEQCQGISSIRFGHQQRYRINNLVSEMLNIEHQGIYPTVLISYNRNRYRCRFSPERINLDWNIEVSRAHSFLAPAPGQRQLPKGVLEVKGAQLAAEGPVCTLIHGVAARKDAFSKYLHAFEWLNQSES